MFSLPLSKFIGLGIVFTSLVTPSVVRADYTEWEVDTAPCDAIGGFIANDICYPPGADFKDYFRMLWRPKGGVRTPTSFPPGTLHIIVAGGTPYVSRYEFPPDLNLPPEREKIRQNILRQQAETEASKSWFQKVGDKADSLGSAIFKKYIYGTPEERETRRKQAIEETKEEMRSRGISERDINNYLAKPKMAAPRS